MKAAATGTPLPGKESLAAAAAGRGIIPHHQSPAAAAAAAGRYHKVGSSEM